MTRASTPTSPPAIAVAIPCYNEAAAIATVDRAVARGAAGGRDRRLRQQLDRRHRRRSRGAWACGWSTSPSRARGTPSGRSSRRSATATRCVLVDGDGTYPAEAAPLLVAPVLDGHGRHDRRGPPAGGRGRGDVAGPRAGQPPDPRGLPPPDRPGHRRPALGLPRLQPAVPPGRSSSAPTGFEIETELASEAVARRLRVVEVSVPYHPRIAGTRASCRRSATAGGSSGRSSPRASAATRRRVILVYCFVLSAVFFPLVRLVWMGAVWLLLLVAGFLGLTTWAALIHRRPSRSPRPAEVEKR